MTRCEENFKQMIIELNQTGRSVRGLAKEYGLSMLNATEKGAKN